MAGTNQFYALATGGGANALTNAAYAALATLISGGYQAGTAQSIQVNSTLRQATSVAAAFGKFIADANFNALDDGNIANLTTAFANALKTVCLPLTGGTLTGGLVGTTGNFSGQVNGQNFYGPAAGATFGTSATDGWQIFGTTHTAQLILNSNGIIIVSAAGEVGFSISPTAGYRIDANGTIRSIGGEAAAGYSFRALNAAGTGGGGLVSNTGTGAGITITGDGGPVNISANGGPKVVINNTGITVTTPDAAPVLGLSGAANKYAQVGVGRTALEVALGVCGQINNFFNGTAVADVALSSTAGNLWIGCASNAGINFVCNNITRFSISNAGAMLVRPDINSTVDLADFHTKSLASNGYQKLPGGVILQWGTSSSIAGDSTLGITFPLAFPNNCFNVQTNVLGNSASVGSVNNSSGVLSKSTSGATLVNDSGTASVVMWFAVGN